MGAPERPELGEELTNSFCRTDPDIAAHFARVTFLSDARADLHKLAAPTLIVQCSDDLIAPFTVGVEFGWDVRQRYRFAGRRASLSGQACSG